MPLEQYLQTPLQLEHACDILLTSELFAFHSERMCELLLEDAKTVRLLSSGSHLNVMHLSRFTEHRPTLPTGTLQRAPVVGAKTFQLSQVA